MPIGPSVAAYWAQCVDAYWPQCGSLLEEHICAPKVAQQNATPSCMNRSNLPPEYAYTYMCIYMCVKLTLMQPTPMHCSECHMPFSNYKVNLNLNIDAAKHGAILANNCEVWNCHVRKYYVCNCQVWNCHLWIRIVWLGHVWNCQVGQSGFVHDSSLDGLQHGIFHVTKKLGW